MTTPRPDIPATADTFVHYLFASPGNEAILRSFVNAVLENAGRPLVKETKVLNPFNPKTFLTDKRSILDIKAVSADHRIFAIEFQVADQLAMVKRYLYYWAKTYSAQLQEGDLYGRLNPVISILVTCFELLKSLVQLHNPFYITAQNDPEIVLTDDFQMHILELVRTKMSRLDTAKPPLQQWLTFLFYADKKSEAEMKVLLQNSDPMVDRAYDEYLRFTQNEELRQIEDARQQYLHDFNSAIDAAEQKGEARGIEKGIEKGRIESLLRILTKRFGQVPQAVIEKLHNMNDLGCLAKLTDMSLDCDSIAEFEAALNN